MQQVIVVLLLSGPINCVGCETACHVQHKDAKFNNWLLARDRASAIYKAQLGSGVRVLYILASSPR
jgi:hypothetical protein